MRKMLAHLASTSVDKIRKPNENLMFAGLRGSLP